MTIATSQSYIALEGDGSNTVFSYPFLIPVPGYAVLTITNTTVSPPVSTALNANQYTITGTGNPTGGTVVYPLSGSPLPSGWFILIARIVPLLQLVTIANQGNFYPAVIESGLDNLEMQIQQINSLSSKAVQFPFFDPPTLSAILPAAAERANLLCGFDSQGNVIAAFSGSSAPVSSVMAPVVDASSLAAATALLEYSNPLLTGPQTRSLAAKLADVMSILDFANVDPTGVDDSSVGFANAIANAKTQARALYVPAGIYRINNPINGTNSNTPLLIYGEGSQATFTFGSMGAVLGNTVIVGNTGPNMPVFDFTGSNDVTLRDIGIENYTASNPSSIGLMFGTSTTSPQVDWVGGSAISLQDISIALRSSSPASIPLAVTGGCGPFDLVSVWLQGDYGAVFSSNNDLSVASPFVTILTGGNVGSVVGNNVAILGSGAGPSLYIDNGDNHTWEELYLSNVNGGPSYAGFAYAIFVQTASSISIKVRVVLWPSVIEISGVCSGINVNGTNFPNTTPVGNGVAAIANIVGTSLANSTFAVREITSSSLPNTNAFYASPSGATPVLTSLNNCTFLFDTLASTFAAFFNVSTAVTVPYFNIAFNGNADGPSIVLERNGTVSTTASQRYFVNGKAFGTG